MVSGEMPGINHNKNGTRNREVRSDDIESPEAAKIIAIQVSRGSQHLRNERILEAGKS